MDEIKTHQRTRKLLRSQTPAGVAGEIYGLVLAHYVVRRVMFEAAKEQGIAPRRISFTDTLKILRCRLSQCGRSALEKKRWYEQLLVEVGEQVLPQRRNRRNPRVIKRKISKWDKKRPHHAQCPQPNTEFHDSFQLLT